MLAGNPAGGGVVVAVGPAPAATADAASSAQSNGPKLLKSGGNVQHEYGGNGGNAAYPEGAAVPADRYNSPWAVSYDAIGPPWSTITAYDLNKGTIKWQ